MDGKQIEERKALKEAVEALDAPPTVPPDGGLAPDQQPRPSKRRRPLQLRRRCRPRKSTG